MYRSGGHGDTNCITIKRWWSPQRRLNDYQKLKIKMYMYLNIPTGSPSMCSGDCSSNRNLLVSWLTIWSHKKHLRCKISLDSFNQILINLLHTHMQDRGTGFLSHKEYNVTWESLPPLFPLSPPPDRMLPSHLFTVPPNNVPFVIFINLDEEESRGHCDW